MGFSSVSGLLCANSSGLGLYKRLSVAPGWHTVGRLMHGDHNGLLMAPWTLATAGLILLTLWRGARGAVWLHGSHDSCWHTPPY